MSADQQTYRRAVSAALTGLTVQITATVVLLVLGLWSGSEVVNLSGYQALGGILLWVTLAIIYQQHRLERIESLEAEQIAARHGKESSIFETSVDELSVARIRLGRLHRWLLPLVGAITGAYLIVVGVWGLMKYTEKQASIAKSLLDTSGTMVEVNPFVVANEPLWLLGICVALSFITFVTSRYMAGMGKMREWQLLRGGAGYLMSLSLICLAMVVAFSMAAAGKVEYLGYLYVGVAGFMVIIGSEMMLNLVLNFYRPRKPGEIPRAAFDSRFLSLLTSPESFAKTISEAIDYQLGFEVTRSWFWQLLSKALGYLVVFGVVSLLGLSCVVMINPQEEGVVTRLGMIGDVVLEPGIHFKLPWPISRVERYDVRRVRTVRAGGDIDLKSNVPILWTNEHTKGKPINLIVAPPKGLVKESEGRASGDGEAEKAPSVSLVNAEMDVQYRINDLLTYVKSSTNSDLWLKDIAQLTVARYLYSRDIDDLIGEARVDGGAVLRERIQKAGDEAGLGIEVIQVNVKSIHPPLDVAEAFHEVVSAQQEKFTTIEQAKQMGIRMLVETAGSTAKGEKIIELINNYEQLKRVDSVEEKKEAEKILQSVILEAGGEAARLISEAHAYRWQIENAERGNVRRFQKELMAYNQAPKLYCMRRYLEVLTEGLKAARKYVLLADRERLIVRFDFKDLETGFEGLNISSNE